MQPCIDSFTKSYWSYHRTICWVKYALLTWCIFIDEWILIDKSSAKPYVEILYYWLPFLDYSTSPMQMTSRILIPALTFLKWGKPLPLMHQELVFGGWTGINHFCLRSHHHSFHSLICTIEHSSLRHPEWVDVTPVTSTHTDRYVSLFVDLSVIHIDLLLSNTITVNKIPFYTLGIRRYPGCSISLGIWIRGVDERHLYLRWVSFLKSSAWNVFYCHGNRKHCHSAVAAVPAR